MQKKTNDTKQLILEAAYRLFYQNGFNRTAIEVIAEEVGITKQAFYYHFESKDILLCDVLKMQSNLSLEHIKKWGIEGCKDPQILTQKIFNDLINWVSSEKWSGSGFTKIIIELNDLPGHPAHSISKDHKKNVESWLIQQYETTTVPNPRDVSRQIMVILEGAMILYMIHKDIEYLEVAQKAAVELVSGQIYEYTV